MIQLTVSIALLNGVILQNGQSLLRLVSLGIFLPFYQEHPHEQRGDFAQRTYMPSLPKYSKLAFSI
jgi:hypothetical protein